MERRELLKTAALLCGSAATGVLLSTPSLAITNAFQQASANAGHSLNLLNTVQLETLRRICELTIPATDTPSAAQVNCHFFIDQIELSSVMSFLNSLSVSLSKSIFDEDRLKHKRT